MEKKERTVKFSKTVIILTALTLLSIVTLLIFLNTKTTKHQNSVFSDVVIDLNKDPELIEKISIEYNFEFNYDNGRKLFKTHCASCHHVDHRELIAPGLAIIYERSPYPPDKWLLTYLLHSDEIKNNKYYLENQDKNYEHEMPVFTNILNEEELRNIFGYITLMNRLEK